MSHYRKSWGIIFAMEIRSVKFQISKDGNYDVCNCVLKNWRAEKSWLWVLPVWNLLTTYYLFLTLRFLQSFRFISPLRYKWLQNKNARNNTGQGDGIKAVGASTVDEVASRNVGQGGKTESEARSSDTADDPRCYVEKFMKRYPDSLDCCSSTVMAVSESNLFIYDGFRVMLDTCVIL